LGENLVILENSQEKMQQTTEDLFLQKLLQKKIQPSLYLEHISVVF